MRSRRVTLTVGVTLVGVSAFWLPGLAPFLAYFVLGYAVLALVHAGLRPGSLSARSVAMTVLLSGTVVGPLAERVDVEASREQAVGDCAGLLNRQETELAMRFETAPRQKRRHPRCNPMLTRVARAKALDMATRGYFSHITPEGEGPNRLVRRGGYQLPSLYNTGRKANNVEAIAAGYETAAEAWASWVDSRKHRSQVLGLNAFHAAQSDYGVGFAEAPGSRYGYYWVLITATRGAAAQTRDER